MDGKVYKCGYEYCNSDTNECLGDFVVRFESIYGQVCNKYFKTSNEGGKVKKGTKLLLINVKSTNEYFILNEFNYSYFLEKINEK